MGCSLAFSPGWEVDSAGGTAGLCQPVERDIYDCYVTCFWPAQVPDHLNNYPDWSSKCAAATKDWRNLDLVFPLQLMKLVCILAALSATTPAATLFLGAYPNSVLVFDESKGQIVDRIPLETGLPRNMRLSLDRRTDLRLHSRSQRHRDHRRSHPQSDQPFRARQTAATSATGFDEGGVLDPLNKSLYTVTTELDKQSDRYEIGKPQYTVIDVAGQKISKTVPISREDEFPSAASAAPVLRSPPTANISINSATAS